MLVIFRDIGYLISKVAANETRIEGQRKLGLIAFDHHPFNNLFQVPEKNHLLSQAETKRVRKGVERNWVALA